MSGYNYWIRRPAHSGITRRRFVAGSAAMGALAAGGLAACGDDDNGGTAKPSGGTAQANAPRQGGTFRYVGAGATGITDPQFGSVPTHVAAWFGDPFLKVSNTDRKLSPGVIEKWEQPDKNTLILKVRPGVKFFNLPPANGRTLEAKDIVYTLRSMTGSLYPDAKIPFPRKDPFFNIKEPVAVDASTVRLESMSPRSDLLLSLAEYRNAVLPEGLREFFGGFDSLFAPKPERLVGTGPFILKAADPQGETIWERNPDYWQKPYPYIERVQHNFLAAGPSQLTAFITGQSYMQTFVLPTDIETIKKGLPNAQFPQYPLNGFYQLAFNTRKKPLDDPRVRAALSIMFDKPGFSKVYVGAEHFPSPLPHAYTEALTQDELKTTLGVRSPTPADIAEAKKMLDAAGVGPFSIGHTSPVDILGVSAFKSVGEHFKEQVEKNLPGVKINIDPTTYTGMLAIVPKPDAWDSYAAGPSQEMTALNMLRLTLQSKGSRNFTGWVSAQFDKLLDDAYAEFDDAKRTAILRDAQRLVLKEWPMLMTHQGKATIAIRPEVQNLEVGGVGFHEHWVRYANLTA